MYVYMFLAGAPPPTKKLELGLLLKHNSLKLNKISLVLGNKVSTTHFRPLFIRLKNNPYKRLCNRLSIPVLKLHT